MENMIFRFSNEVHDWTGTDAHTTKMTLGGKGAGLVMMTQAGMPVPPGFTITTKACNIYRENADHTATGEWFSTLMCGVTDNDAWLETQFGFAPLVSVRSGAPISMPGMMDTILNVGLSLDNVGAWAERIGERAAYDSLRRLMQMLGATAYGIKMSNFDAAWAATKKTFGVTADTDVGVDGLQAAIAHYDYLYESLLGHPFPTDRHVQMAAAVKAVFDSWMNPRAIEYRKLNGIDEAMGTAVTVQTMVFGNMGDDSGTGVLFTRNPSTGEPGMYGEYLPNAQGEDVVAGIRTPIDVWDMNTVEMDGTIWPGIYKQLVKLCSDLETHYNDMVDIEFTVQQGKLFVLQSRNGKRSAPAAFKIAYDLVNEGVLEIGQALKRVNATQFKIVRRPGLDPKFKTPPTWTGLPACPGVVTGKPVFSSQEAVDSKVPCILITHETTPDDIKGMNAALGILTQTGGATSHAAVVARAMDKACVVGCTDLDLNGDWQDVERVTIDGATGKVWLQIEVPVIDSSDLQEVQAIMEWCARDMGASITTPVPLKTDKAHTVMAAQWWGNPMVMKATIEQLTKAGYANVTLDIRPPSSFGYAIDNALLDCFGELSETQFQEELVKELNARAGKLKGLVVVAEAPVRMMLDSALVGSEKGPTAVPADYAAFTVLAG